VFGSEEMREILRLLLFVIFIGVILMGITVVFMFLLKFIVEKFFI